MADAKKSNGGTGENIEVIDRRRLTSEGTVRPEVAAEQAEPKAPPKVEPPPREPAPGKGRQAEKAYESRRPGHEVRVDFRALVLSLSTTAMYQLGLLAEPGAPPPEPDLVAARQTIDLLSVVEEKTRNNLTADEKQLLEQVLYELRMSYLALERK